MKIISKGLVLLLILALLFSTVLVLISPSKISSFNIENGIFSLEEKILESDLDIYGVSTLSISEEELNHYLVPIITESVNEAALPSFINLKGIYFDLKDSLINVKSSIGIYFLSLGINLDISPIFDDNSVGIKLEQISLGKIPLPLSIVEFIGIELNNNIYYLENLKLSDSIKINNIIISEDKTDIKFTTNNKALIDRYISKNNKEIQTIIDELSKTKVSKRFANNIIKALIIYENEKEIPRNLITQLRNDFGALDTGTKLKLAYILSKYELQEIQGIINKYIE